MIKLARTEEGKLAIRVSRGEWEKIGLGQGWLEAEAKGKTKGKKKAYPICMKTIQDKHGPKSEWSDFATEKFDSCVEKVQAKSAANPSMTARTDSQPVQPSPLTEQLEAIKSRAQGPHSPKIDARLKEDIETLSHFLEKGDGFGGAFGTNDRMFNDKLRGIEYSLRNYTSSGYAEWYKKHGWSEKDIGEMYQIVFGKPMGGPINVYDKKSAAEPPLAAEAGSVSNPMSPVIYVPGLSPKIPSPSKEISRNETNRFIQDAFSRLAPEEASVIGKLFGFEGDKMSEEDVSLETGMDADMVKRLAGSGMQKLMDYFRELKLEDPF